MENNSTYLIETENLNVYQEDKKVLENVNIKIELGEFAYFIGKVGSGKSSLLKTFYSELELKEGGAKVVGYDLKKIKNKNIPMLRRKIGMVFQDFELMADRTVFKNLEFVLKATNWKSKIDIETRINEVLESVGMLDKKYAMPTKLSGGEKQSVSIARALLNNPPIIFADEPTGNLDPESANSLMEILHQLPKQGKSVIMVTHNHAFLKKFPGRVFLFENEAVIEQFEQGIDL
ncbi:MAG: ATP-binding cassette domain-containing protein [Bacteroidales bacterium]|nr:ATP-binding cassette domain-containing protein [Bacteroidales bacterium]MCK9499327.1 ATP-binding cassette domain-containing protein [Bacteroidales bacterium]MDY0315382.1 ATP-binding cassette domain-containing protein [Bacteroidales bacterium]